MLPCVPTSAVVGVPLKRPVAALNVVHAGRLSIVKVSTLPSASPADGANENCDPVSTWVDGVPEIHGARFVGAVTFSENAGSAVVAWPSLTRITMLG